MARPFSYYPEVEDVDFDQRIYKKKEFYDTRYESNLYSIMDDGQEHQDYLKERCDPNFFKLQNYQIFVRNYLSPATPYNGLLLFHGVGTGKTCAAIQIAEGFKDDVNKQGKKITVVASKVLQDNFKDNLYSFQKELESGIITGQNQCTGNTYYLPKQANQTPESRTAQIRALQEKYYQYITYAGFAKDFDEYLKSKNINSEDPEDKKAVIKAIRK